MTQEALATVTTWFSIVRLASLELPSGWFGGPRRSLHQLTNAVAWHDRLILELDQQLLLVITAPSVPLQQGNELVIERFDQLVFDWQEFANRRPHSEAFTSGAIRFVGQG